LTFDVKRPARLYVQPGSRPLDLRHCHPGINRVQVVVTVDPEGSQPGRLRTLAKLFC
jgi:hypothetical protein